MSPPSSPGPYSVLPDEDSQSRNPAAFLLSIAIHGCVLGFIFNGPPPVSHASRPVYDSFIRPNEKRIIWYRKLPQISPTRTADFTKPQGAMKSAATRIATATSPTNSRQLILQEAPQLKMDQDLKVPNLIAFAAPAVPTPQPKIVKQFVLPPAISKPPRAVPLVEAPALEMAPKGPLETERPLRPFTAKRFTPPPPVDRAKLPYSKPAEIEAPPEFGSGAGAGPLKGLSTAASLVKMPAKPFTATAPRKSTGVAGGVSLEPAPNMPAASGLNVAIVGLHPIDQLNGPIPLVARPAQLSAAPTEGKTATGGANGAALAVSGLTVKEATVAPIEPGGSPGAVAPQTRLVFYSDLVRKSLLPAFSTPLRPVSRSIPFALESRFRGRFVYVMVVPAPDLPAYAGDWILWFSERTQSSGDLAVLMRAPMPLQKIERVDHATDPGAGDAETRLQLSAFVTVNGRLESIVVVKGPNSPICLEAVEDLKNWEFRPAMRNGSPTEVEVVIEIPFRSAWLNRSL